MAGGGGGERGGDKATPELIGSELLARRVGEHASVQNPQDGILGTSVYGEGVGILQWKNGRPRLALSI